MHCRRSALRLGTALLLATLWNCQDGTSPGAGTSVDPSGTVDLSQPQPVPGDMAAPAEIVALSAVSPGLAPTAGGTVVTLTGTRFQPGASVQIAGVAAENVRVDSATQITATVPARAGTQGYVAVKVNNPDGTSVTRSDLFSYYSETLSFSTPTLIMGQNPVAAVDVNQDGKLDLVAIVSGSAITTDVVTVFGIGDGGFSPAKTFTVSKATGGATLADINGDKKHDLVTVNGENMAFAGVRLGNADGTFGAYSQYAIPGFTSDYARIGAAGDLNGDGFSDVVVMWNSSPYVVMLGNGDGTLGTPKAGVGFPPYSAVDMRLADLNKDGKLDLIVDRAQAGMSAHALAVQLGRGDGTFAPASDLPAICGRMGLIGDADGDGSLDVVVNGNFFPIYQYGVLFGRGDGTFKPQGSCTSEPMGVGFGTAADFNGDRKIDVLLTKPSSQGFHIALGKGDGTFTNAYSGLMGASAYGPLAADFNKDGRVDLAMSSLIILLNTSN